MTRFSKFLKERIKSLGYTQEFVANQIHVDAKTISKWCVGRGEPSRGSIKALADVLEISIYRIQKELLDIKDENVENIEMVCNELLQKILLTSYVKERPETAKKDIVAIKCCLSEDEYQQYLYEKELAEGLNLDYSIVDFCRGKIFVFKKIRLIKEIQKALLLKQSKQKMEGNLNDY